MASARFTLSLGSTAFAADADKPAETVKAAETKAEPAKAETAKSTEAAEQLQRHQPQNFKRQSNALAG